MYIPPFQMLQDAITSEDGGNNFVVPKRLFHMLLQAAVIGHFDANWYRAAYPDVADSVDRREIRSEIVHYAEGGYREGRMPCSFTVCDDWYKSTYPDIAVAIEAGEVASAHTHYNQSGYIEGRVPDAASADTARLWAEALTEPQSLARSRQRSSR